MVELPVSDIIEWDIPNWSHALDFWDRYLPPLGSNLKILTIGERNGGLSLWLALKGYQVIYSDVHPPKKEALALHKKYGVERKVEHAQVDVFQMPYADHSLDVVICKSVIGGLKLVYSDRRTRTLENQKKAVEEIRRVLKPGGVFLGAENMVGSPVHRWYRKRKGLDKGWRYLSLGDLRYLFSEYASLHTRQFGFLPASTSFRVWNELAGKLNVPLAKFLPASWQYISFIAARK